eukprot:TRINITY_DN5028_c0_g1_i1.p1 TRINITY_DN5028_c0_g1~~TRINITY_DN5028_c0_g1_i1.p1  ORF type:complete len:657 (-),score=156.55 TRINITY_DN5028_c0_g1_i1:52-2022(-)
MEDFLDCEICFESFALHVPKILGCGHTLCDACVYKILSDKKVVCPSCKKQTPIPNGDVSQLPTNYLAKRMAEKKKEESAEKGKQKTPLCREHSKKLELFCENAKCMKLICSDCKGHTKHEYKFIDTAFAFYREKLVEKIRTNRNVVQKLVETENLINNLQKEKTVAKENVKNTMKRIREWSTEREEFLLDEINLKANKSLASLEKQQQTLIQLKKPLDDIERNVFESSSDNAQFSLLENVSTYFQQIDKISNTNIGEISPSKSNSFVEFQSSGEDNIKSLVLNFGKVVANQTETKTQVIFETTTPPSSPPQRVENNNPPPKDYRQIFEGRELSVRIYGPDLKQKFEFGKGFGKLDHPQFCFVVPKEWFSPNDSSSSSKKKEPFSDEDLLVTSDFSNHRVLLIKKVSGKVKSAIGGGNGNKLGELNGPTGICVVRHSSSSNLILVCADHFNSRVQSFDLESGKYLNHFSNPKYMKLPFSIAVHQQTGEIFVANSESNNISIHQGYRPSANNNNDIDFGTLLKVIGQSSIFNTPLKQPLGLAINSKGEVIVASHHKIDVFGGIEYKLVRSFGSKGEGNNEFNQPSNVCVDTADNILVCDSLNHAIKIFNPEGKFITSFGKKGNDGMSFDSPIGIFLDQLSGDIFVADSENSKIVHLKL